MQKHHEYLINLMMYIYIMYIMGDDSYNPDESTYWAYVLGRLENFMLGSQLVMTQSSIYPSNN